MTCIAYKDGILAADTLMVNCDRKGYTNKLFTHGNEAIALCGDFARALEMLEWYQAGAVTANFPAKRDENDFGRLVIATDCGVCTYENRPYPVIHTERFVAYGTGADFAVGAMAMGASAEQAVKVAIEHCASCGGVVESLNVRMARGVA